MYVTLHRDLDSGRSETSRVLSESEGVTVDINGIGREKARITVTVGAEKFEFTPASDDGIVYLVRNGETIAVSSIV